MNQTNLDLFLLARKAELNGDWETAKKIWIKVNQPNDAKACQLIIEAIEAGNEFRYRNEICPVCNIISLKTIENCPNCNVIKAKVNCVNK